MKRYVLAGFLAAMLMLLGSAAGADPRGDSDAPQYETVTVTIPIGAYEIDRVDDGYDISVEGFGRLLVPGKPNIHSRIFSIAIPPGAEMVEQDNLCCRRGYARGISSRDKKYRYEIRSSGNPD